MHFTGWTYDNFVTQSVEAQRRLFPDRTGGRRDFDLIVIGSGMGGGLLADDLADRLHGQRILVLEAGSYLYPTHVYNLCRFSNADVARHFGCGSFWQPGGSHDSHYIHERPQLNFGGRSIFWSGLIPTVQDWELDFFPPRVRADLKAGLLDEAGRTMNVSQSLGSAARAMVERLRASDLAGDFVIEETPRAVHQPYLMRDGGRERYFFEPTGVFNTAELLINQLGLAGPRDEARDGLYLRLSSFVEDVRELADGRYELVVRDVLDGSAQIFRADTVVLAGGSIESPKLLRRSTSLVAKLPDHVRAQIGVGLTDHPTTNSLETWATHLHDLPLYRDEHAKIVFYSRGRRDADGSLAYPFNVEMNVNHEYWHLRENDPGSPAAAVRHEAASRIDIKFSFGNCRDARNAVLDPPPYGYVPEIRFRNLGWMDDLAGSRLPALAGWHKSYDEIFAVLNHTAWRIFSQFSRDGQPARPDHEIWYGQGGKGFGLGTVHHAACSLSMPSRAGRDQDFDYGSALDEDLRLNGSRSLYVCDMSAMPFSSAANPVRTLAALALRLSRHLGR